MVSFRVLNRSHLEPFEEMNSAVDRYFNSIKELINVPIGSIFTLNTVKQHQYLAKNFLLTTIELCTYGKHEFILKYLKISIPEYPDHIN